MKLRDKNTGRFLKTGKELRCDFCKHKKYIPFYRLNKSKNHFCSKSCNNKFRIGILGRNYINGSSYEKYPVEFNMQLKDIIKNRDERICVLCGINDTNHRVSYNKSLTVHHIDYDKKNCDKNNLITLCLRHNSMVNKKSARKRWIKCFKIIINLQKGILD